MRQSLPPSEIEYASFEPSLENKFWAISTYPQKSVSSATESFVAYHQEKNPEMERTKNEWQDSWRKWMQGQNDERGYNSKLEKEQNHIVLDTFGTIFKCISELFVQLHPRDSIYNLLCKENYNFSKKTVDAGLKHLESRGYIKRLFKDYYYAAECENETNGLSYEPDFQAIYCEYDEINPKIQKYISDNVVVHLDDLLSRCTDEHKDSLKLFLDIGVDCNFLFEIDGYYFDYLRFEDGQDGIREKINRKLESFGIKNPVEIDDEGGENPEVWGDDFYEGLADYTIPLIPEESEPADVFLV